jgi:hypothetical protein
MPQRLAGPNQMGIRIWNHDYSYGYHLFNSQTVFIYFENELLCSFLSIRHVLLLIVTEVLPGEIDEY